MIQYILQRADEEEVSIGKTRLMKLLYLLDVEFYRLYRKTYTELEWVFYKFGPFAFEIEGMLQSIGVTEEEIPLKGDKIFKKIVCEYSMPREEYTVPLEARNITGNLIKEWGLSDLNELLDYVYFETEPMENAKFNEKLDFSKVVPFKKEEIVKISLDARKKIKQVCENIKTRLEKIEKPILHYSSSKTDLEITSIWDKEETPNLSYLSGMVTFKKDNK